MPRFIAGSGGCSCRAKREVDEMRRGVRMIVPLLFIVLVRLCLDSTCDYYGILCRLQVVHYRFSRVIPQQRASTKSAINRSARCVKVICQSSSVSMYDFGCYPVTAYPGQVRGTGTRVRTSRLFSYCRPQTCAAFQDWCLIPLIRSGALTA